MGGGGSPGRGECGGSWREPTNVFESYVICTYTEKHFPFWASASPSGYVHDCQPLPPILSVIGLESWSEPAPTHELHVAAPTARACLRTNTKLCQPRESARERERESARAMRREERARAEREREQREREREREIEERDRYILQRYVESGVGRLQQAGLLKSTRVWLSWGCRVCARAVLKFRFPPFTRTARFLQQSLTHIYRTGRQGSES
jgi:hypothetical protein